MIARKPTGKNAELEVTYPLLGSGAALGADDTVQLTVEASATDYIVKLAAGEVSASVTFTAEALTINPPVGCAFCGAMFGLYAFGKSEPALDTADFWDIEIVERS